MDILTLFRLRTLEQFPDISHKELEERVQIALKMLRTINK